MSPNAKYNEEYFDELFQTRKEYMALATNQNKGMVRSGIASMLSVGVTNSIISYLAVRYNVSFADWVYFLAGTTVSGLTFYASLEGVFNYSERLQQIAQTMMKGAKMELEMKKEMARDLSTEIEKVMEMDLVL